MTMTSTFASTIADALPVYRTDLPLPERREGKVRDVYRMPASRDAGPQVLIVASDRISAFDVVLPDALPGKGRVLTAVAEKWFEFVRSRGIIADHLISTDPADVPALDASHRPVLEGRMMLGRAAEVIPIEFVVRGFIAGSGWAEYQRNGAVCGVPLPAGLQKCERLPEPIFTPATKATVGHDENIDFDRACTIAGRDVMERLRDVSMRLYTEALEYAEERGILLADTKFEFGYALDDDGRRTDEIILIDEVLTPDSSRFWPADEYEPGREPASFDKQIVRNELLTFVEAGTWDKTPPAPSLSREIIDRALRRYVEVYEKLFG